MKCQSCGWHYFLRTRCPHCGANGMEPKNAVASFLATPVSLGNFTFNILYLYFFLAVNVSVVALVVNLIVYNTKDGLGGIWAQYVVAGAFALFVLLRTSFIQRKAVLTTVRHLAYLLLTFFAVTQWATWNGAENAHLLAYVIPITYMLLSLFAFFALALKWTTSGSFYFTLGACAVISVAPFILALKLNMTMPGQIVNYIAFGVAMISFVNAFFLKMLSMLFRAREGKLII